MMIMIVCARARVCVFAVPGTGFIHPIHALLVDVTLARNKGAKLAHLNNKKCAEDHSRVEIMVM